MTALSIQITPEDYKRVIGFYVRKRHYAPVAQLYEELLRLTPNDPNLMANLATVYRELGRLDRARELALQAAAASPAIAAQLQPFLNSLEPTSKANNGKRP